MTRDIYHCRWQWPAEQLLLAVKQRLAACGLEAHPQKTRLVYCKDSTRKREYPVITFDFLGYTFRPRAARNRKGQNYTRFSPSMSVKAFKRIRTRIRQWGVTRWSGRTPKELAEMLNPAITGWLNYYGHFGKADGVYRLRKCLDQILMFWAKKKYKHLRRSYRKSWAFIHKLQKQSRYLFVHWNMKQAEYEEPYESRGSRTVL